MLEFLLKLLLPPIREAFHGDDSGGEFRVEIEIHATVDCWDGAFGIQSLLNVPCVSCADFAWLKYAQIKACTVFADGQFDPVPAAYAACLIGTWDARTGYLHKNGAGPNDITNAYICFEQFAYG